MGARHNSSVFPVDRATWIDGARMSKSVAYVDVESPTAESLLLVLRNRESPGESLFAADRHFVSFK